MRRDVICVQIGTAANYVGAHFWNLQDEYLAIPPAERELSPSTFFRAVAPGSRSARQGLLYTPRLQVVDSTGAFGALSTQSGAVLSDADAANVRNAPLPSTHASRYVRAPTRKSTYAQALLDEEGNSGAALDVEVENDVHYWTDYLKTRLDPRTCMPLPGVHHGVSKLDMFEKGVELARPALLEDLYDELRPFIEECDEFGGVCMFAGSDNAWAGLSAKYAGYLYEELGQSCPVFMFGVHDVHRTYTRRSAAAMQVDFDPAFEARCAQNEARLIATCMEYSTEYAPLSSQETSQIPLVHAKSQDLFHSSAVLGLMVNVAFTPLQERLSMSGLINGIRPAPFSSFGSLAGNCPPSSMKLSFGRTLFETVGSVNFSSAWKEGSVLSGKTSVPHISTCLEVSSARGLGYHMPVFSNVSCPLTVPIPFPRVFDFSLERNKSAVVDSGNPQDSSVVEQIGLLASLGTVAADGHSALRSLGTAVNPAKKPRNARGGATEEQELREVSEALLNRSADYLSLSH